MIHASGCTASSDHALTFSSMLMLVVGPAPWTGDYAFRAMVTWCENQEFRTGSRCSMNQPVSHCGSPVQNSARGEQACSGCTRPPPRHLTSPPPRGPEGGEGRCVVRTRKVVPAAMKEARGVVDNACALPTTPPAPQQPTRTLLSVNHVSGLFCQQSIRLHSVSGSTSRQHAPGGDRGRGGGMHRRTRLHESVITRKEKILGN